MPRGFASSKGWGRFSARLKAPPLPEEPGRSAGAAGVSEPKRPQGALREAEEKYRSIFEKAVEGIFRLTAEGHFLVANPTLARIYGYNSPEELILTVTKIGNLTYLEGRLSINAGPPRRAGRRGLMVRATLPISPRPP